ncbi:TARBP1 (predicted), partial [Pycnogonum litorale]
TAKLHSRTNMAGGECCSLKLILSCVKDVGIYGALNNILEEIESDILVHEIIEPCKVNLLISVLEECYRERGPNQYPVDRHEVMTKCQRLVLHIMNSSSLNKLRNEVAFNVLTCFNKFVKCFLENSNKHPNNFIKELFETVIRTLNYEDTASNNNANRKASVILELAETLITWLNRDLIGIYSKEYNHFVSAIINHLVTGSQSETYTLTYYKLLPAVVKHSPNVLNQLLNSTFTLINDDTRTNDFSKMLTLLSAVVDYELDVDAVIKLSAYKFCYVLQQCICGGDPVLKKKSLFLLKIISSLLQATQSTYWRASESCWIDLVLVYECLGESQVHVIQPVLPKINFLITTSLNEDQLHVSWILVILQLMLTHESKIINRWGIEIFLENTIAISNLKQPEIQKFAEELLLPALNNCSLYPRSCDVNLNTSCPSVTSALIKFFREFSKHALNDEDCRIFFCRTIHNICDISWNAVPLVYLLYSLTQLPSRFLLSDCCINYFSDLMCAPVSSPSHQASVKTVLQILVAKVVFQLIDMKSINLSSLSKLFANFKPNYFFVDSPLWKEVVEWMANVRKLNDLHVCFSKYLKVIKKELSFEKRNFNGCENPESLSPVKIREAVRMLLLIIDSGYFEQHSDSFRQYFDPMVDVLTSLNTRLYMPPQIIRQALTMFKLLLQHSRIRDDVARNLTVYDLTVELAETCSTEIVKYVAITTANSVENEECLDVLLIPILNSLVLYPSIKCKIIQQLMSAADNWLSSILNSQKPNDSAEGILYKYNSLKMLSWITAAASSNGIPSSKLLKLVKGRNDILSSFRNVGGSRGQFKSDYVDYVWKLINYYINSDSQWSHNIDYQSLLNDSLSALDVSSNCTVITIMNCLSTILNQVPGISPSLFEKCLSSVWSIAIEHKGNEYFKMIVDAFINMAYKMESLKNCEYTSVLVKYTKLIYDSSVSGSGVYILLVNRFADILISNQGQNIDKENIQILIYGLIYGTVYRKDQRILNDVIMFVKEEFDSKISISSMLIEDQTVRSTSILLLTYLSCMHHDLIEDITERLLEQIEKISSGKRCRHFANSLTHRLQQRLWQAFLVLQPKWS